VATNTLKSLKSDYDLLFASCLIRPAKAAAVDQIVDRIRANRSRYEEAGNPRGVPWYVVGMIHMMESSGDFSKHLHNGDPLTARTVQVPAGRPAKGTPPFSWEESAADALDAKGFGSWTDWTVAGTLFKLESYNGFGYRDNHPEVKSPYLWSFSNHYSKGKYVADRKFDPNAVSAQCGVAVVLRRLKQLKLSDGVLKLEPRQLTLTNPYMVGSDVEEAQRLLAKNPFENFQPGEDDGEYGPISADATRRAKFALGYADKDVNRAFGPILRAYLDGSKPLPKANQALRAKRLKERKSEDGIRKAIVEMALWGVANSDRIAYSQDPIRIAGLKTRQGLPLATDCSAFATLCYAWAGAPNPNEDGPFDPAGPSWTGSMLSHCRRIPRSAVKPGDLVAWTPPGTGSHVCVVIQTGPDPMLVSHGGESGPLKIRFSAEDSWQRTHGHHTAVWLTAF